MEKCPYECERKYWRSEVISSEVEENLSKFKPPTVTKIFFHELNPNDFPAQIKMATLPECSKLRYLSNNKDDWPVLQCKHIFILPGVPQFFEKKVELVASYLSTELIKTETPPSP